MFDFQFQIHRNTPAIHIVDKSTQHTNVRGELVL